MRAKLCRNYVLEVAKCCGSHMYKLGMFCSKCYIRLVKLKNFTHPSEGIRKSAKDQIENAKRMWTPFYSTVEVAGCSVCCMFRRGLKGLHSPTVEYCLHSLGAFLRLEVEPDFK